MDIHDITIQDTNISSINYSNIFDFCIGTNNVDTCNFYISSKIIYNTIMMVGMKNNKICKYSNEWLYLIDIYYYQPSYISYYSHIADISNHISNNLNNPNNIIIHDEVFSLVTAFSIGTVHGYSALHYLLYIYINNYVGKKVIIYKNSQKGIIELVVHYLKVLYGESYQDYLLILEPDTLYTFRNIIFIPNKYHVYEVSFHETMNLLLEKYVMPFRKERSYYINLLNGKSLDNICIFKTHSKLNITQENSLDINQVVDFCNKNNYTLIRPELLNELDLIHILSYTKKFITMPSSCYQKNFIYLSNDCEKIVLYTITPELIYEYKQNIFQKQFKNAIYEIIIGDNLS